MCNEGEIQAKRVDKNIHKSNKSSFFPWYIETIKIYLSFFFISNIQYDPPKGLHISNNR